MVIFREFLFVAGFGVFFLNGAFATKKLIEDPISSKNLNKKVIEKNVSQKKRKILSEKSTTDVKKKKQKISSSQKKQQTILEKDKENEIPKINGGGLQTILKDEDYSQNPNPSITEESPLKKYLSPMRRDIVYGKYEGDLTSPQFRKIFSKNDSGNYYTRKVFVLNKYVLQADHLFNPYALVLNNIGKWETNLQRMNSGRSPVAQKGIANEEERKNLTPSQIRSKQSPFIIELHHVTQKDTGTNEDPICEITRRAHMGRDGRLLVKVDEEQNSVNILASSLSKDAALLMRKDGQTIEKNLLHFRKGKSLIDRESFSKWRIDYWKERAKEIEKGNFDPTPPKSPRSRRVLIFENSDDEIKENNNPNS